MQFQKRLIKVVAMFLCALTITFSITSSLTINSYAAESTASASAELTLTKVIDMALTKTGVIANNNWLQKVQASFLNMMNGTASSYSSYCESNGLEKNEETWTQYLSSDAYIGLGFAIPNFVLQSVWAIEWMLAPEQYAEEQKQMQAAVQALAETATCVQAETYKLKDEAVEFVRDTFDDIVAEEGLGYYYVPTMKPSDVDVNWFNNSTYYNNFKTYINSSDNVTAISVASNSSYKFYDVYLYSNANCFNYVAYNKNSGFYLYNDDWSSGKLLAYHFNLKSNYLTINYSDEESFKTLTGYTNKYEEYTLYQNSTLYSGTFVKSSYVLLLFTKDGRQQIVYKTYNDFKNYNGGNKPVYHVTSDTYDITKDNSISYTGDYIINNGQNYSYDTVQNTIDNSVDNSTDESVTTIVNDSYNTIINNYYYTSPDSGEGGSGDSDDDSSGGGIGAIIDGIGSLLNFIVTLIGDVLSLIGSFLDTVYDMIKNLGGSFTNFSGLMGELFTFIPQDLMDLIEAGIGVAIVIVIWKMFKS